MRFPSRTDISAPIAVRVLVAIEAVSLILSNAFKNALVRKAFGISASPEVMLVCEQ